MNYRSSRISVNNITRKIKTNNLNAMNKELLCQLKTEREFKDFILTNLECPIDCKDGSNLKIIAQELIELWKNVCSKYSIAREEDFIREHYETEPGLFQSEDLDEFKRVSLNLVRWIDEAKKDYLDITKIFNSQMASSKDYPKHYLQNKIDQNAIIKLAIKNNISYFFPEIDENYLQLILLDSFTEYFNLILKSENLRFGVKVAKDIGISKTGTITKFMLFEINKSAQIAHAYPCDANEISNLNIEPQFFDKVHFDWLREEL